MQNIRLPITTNAHSHTGNVDICLELLANGAELECIDKRGCIPLHWSAEYGHSKVTDVLLADMRSVRGYLRGM